MLRKVMTASLSGVDADFVMVETDLQSGLPGVQMVGLADTTIKEARERIKSAIVNSGFLYPRRKLTVNLSPASLPKEGSHFDLPIAIGILGTEDENIETDGYGFIGELSLDGDLKSIRGALPLAMRLREGGVKRIILPEGNASEAALLKDVEIYPVKNLKECVGFLSGKVKINRYIIEEKSQMKVEDVPDFIDVIGQETVKRALVIAAAGNHGVLMMGSPGCGKTMMAKRLPYIMPDMTYEEILEVTKIYSAAGLSSGLQVGRPFRAPHHTITKTALIGGGRIPHPGEISLAHNGILFLDEFGEFDTATIELLRQPIEEGYINIGRARKNVRLPSRIMLVAAANPCKCGYYGDDQHMCTCSTSQLQRYIAKFSGPMLDRIDMHIRVPNVSLIGDAKRPDRAQPCRPGLSTAQMKAAVQRAADIQNARYIGTGILSNGNLTEVQIKKYCIMTPDAEAVMEQAAEKYGFSMRIYYKILRVARTIADLDESAIGDVSVVQAEPACPEKLMFPIQFNHVVEAISFRGLDHFYRRDIDD